MLRYRKLIALQSGAILLGLFFIIASDAEEECLRGNTYWCFECDSWSDPRCKDPFNYTEKPAQKQCGGCCVKIVTNYKQPNEEVRRTCTKNIVINLFMVDHVCMYEGHNTGHMCFCEGDLCNSGPARRPPSLVICLLICLCAFLSYRWLAHQ